MNFYLPNDVEYYIHHIGRMVRAAAKETTITFFSHINSKAARELCDLIINAGQEVSEELAGRSLNS